MNAPEHNHGSFASAIVADISRVLAMNLIGSALGLLVADFSPRVPMVEICVAIICLWLASVLNMPRLKS